MTEISYSAKDAIPITVLKDAFGDEVTLVHNGEEESCVILREFRLGNAEYAVLQPDQRAAQDEQFLLLRITRDETDRLELATIEDDDEWEAIAEVYDEMTFEP